MFNLPTCKRHTYIKLAWRVREDGRVEWYCPECVEHAMTAQVSYMPWRSKRHSRRHDGGGKDSLGEHIADL